MSNPINFIKTDRIILRSWKNSDLDLFAKLNADPEVMSYFPSPLSKEESDKLALLISQEIENHAMGLWALEIPGVSEFAGFVGIRHIPYKTPFTPAVEIGWRLAQEFWGQGYATEGAIEALKYGFDKMSLPEIVAFTYEGNMPSRRVMEKIKMTYDPEDDFDHPNLPKGHPLRKHVLYRMNNHYLHS